MRAAADERWTLTLRSTANLVGFALYPVGWSWNEYAPPRYGKALPYEDKAASVGCLGIQLEVPISEEAQRAIQNGNSSRRDIVERRLLRMIKRQEIPVTLINHRMEGAPLDDRMRLDVALRFDVEMNAIGLFDLQNSNGFDFQTDTIAVFDALEDQCAWTRNSSANNWFYMDYRKHGTTTHRRLLNGMPNTTNRNGNRQRLNCVNCRPAFTPNTPIRIPRFKSV
jgi:hypothetical protein